MSTPTANATHPSRPPTSHTTTTTPSTLTHLASATTFSSPAHRSVPSPAAHRSAALTARSPAAANAAAHTANASLPQNHPTGSSRGGLLGSSPAAGAGIHLDSPSAGNLAPGVDMGVTLSQMGGVGMGLSMSALGLTGGSSMGLGGARADDEERRRRLEGVIGLLKRKAGRVGEESIRRVAEGFGLDWDAVDGPGGGRVLTIAGTKSLIVDVELRGDAVEKVKMDVEGVSGAWASSSDVLLRDLREERGTAGINLTVRKFARNLEVVARMEKLSSPSVNCFAAISGVYGCLRKLFEHEKKIARAILDAKSPDADEKAEREVLCKKSGRPRMSAGDMVGLSLEYWMDRRHIISTKPKPRNQAPKDVSGDRMDIDEPSNTTSTPDSNPIYSIQIECESSPSGLYPSIRVSDAWISDAIEKTTTDDITQELGDTSLNTSGIDWLDPPPTYVQEENTDALAISDEQEKLPPVRFVARFSPSLVLPLNTAVALHQDVQSQIPQESIRPISWDSLVLKPGSEGEMRLVEGMKEVRSERSVYIPGPEDAETIHKNALFLPRNEFGLVLNQIPFSHPRQLVQMLPTLRQFALLNSLLRDSFADLPPSPSSPLIPSKPLKSLPPLHLDITLDALLPHPRLTAIFPRRASLPPTSNGTALDALSLDDILGLGPTPARAPLAVALEIGANAEIGVLAQNVDADAAAKDGGEGDAEEVRRAQRRRARVGRGLEVCGDWGVWVEWVRREEERGRDGE